MTSPTPSPSEDEPTDPRDAELTADEAWAELQQRHPDPFDHDWPEPPLHHATDWYLGCVIGRDYAARRAVERTGEGRGGKPEAGGPGLWGEPLWGAMGAYADESGQAVLGRDMQAAIRAYLIRAAPPTPPRAEGLREAVERLKHAPADHDAIETLAAFARRALAALSTAGTGEAADVGAGQANFSVLAQPDIHHLARKAVSAFDDLVNESQGVYGLHLNGDPSPWSEVQPGGRYEEWTSDIEELRSALSTPAPTPSASIGMSSVDFAPTTALTGAGETLEAVHDCIDRHARGELTGDDLATAERRAIAAARAAEAAGGKERK